jgi:hypothetical protein
MSDKKKIRIDVLIWFVFFLSSQIFYIHILYSEGLNAFMTYLAPDNIHEQLQNQSLMTNQLNRSVKDVFDFIEWSFSWPNSFWGLVTGIGVSITTLAFGVLGKIGFLFLLLALLAPLIFLVTLIVGIACRFSFYQEGIFYFILAVSFFLTCVLFVISFLNHHSPYGWGASLLVGLSFIYKYSGFYLNSILYVFLSVVIDFYGIKNIFRLSPGLR